MNARDVLKYGHQTILKTIEGLSEKEWSTIGATSAWTVKDALAHLTSYEKVLEGVLTNALYPDRPTPTLDAYRNSEDFNEAEVATHKDRSVDDVVKEYNAVHDRVMGLITQIPEETLRQVGTIPWYGPEYSLDDFIVYHDYGHKREHSGQIKLFLKRLRG